MLCACTKVLLHKSAWPCTVHGPGPQCRAMGRSAGPWARSHCAQYWAVRGGKEDLICLEQIKQCWGKEAVCRAVIESGNTGARVLSPQASQF